MESNGLPAPSAAHRTQADEVAAELRSSANSARRRDRVARLVAPLVTAGVLLVLWQYWANNTTSLMVPKATDTLRELANVATDSEVWSAIWLSAQALFVAYGLSALGGIAFGVVMARHRLVGRFAGIWVSIMLVTPMAVIVPVLLMATGIGTTTRVIVIVIFVAPVIIVNSEAGIKSVDRRLTEMARSFGAKERQLWWSILLPAAVPGILAGLRLGLSRAISAVFIVELIFLPVGIGGLILDARARFQADRLYALVLLVLLIAIALIMLMELAERIFLPWAQTTRKASRR